MRASYLALGGLVLAGLPVPSQAGLITLSVGGGGQYQTLSAAVAAANADTNLANLYHIDMAAGTYLNDFAPAITRPMEIFGAGAGQTILQATQALPNQKGLLLTFASLYVRGLTLTGAFIGNAAGGNGAGIRDQATGPSTLRVEDTTFRGNQEGILEGGSGHQENVIITNSKFIDNGNTSTNDGQEHGIYINDAASLTVSNSSFCGQKDGGHNIKSRAAATTITGVTSWEGVAGGGCADAGDASRGIDLPNGGVVAISNTNLFQGSGSPNFSLMEFGAEGLKYAQNSLSLDNVAFNSSEGGVGIQWFAGASPCTFDNVTFSGVANQTSVAGACTTGTVVDPPPVVVAPPPVIDAPVGDSVPVNEPSTWAMLLAALGGMLVLRRSMMRHPQDGTASSAAMRSAITSRARVMALARASASVTP